MTPLGCALLIWSHPVRRWQGQSGWAGWFSRHTGNCKLWGTHRATPGFVCATWHTFSRGHWGSCSDICSCNRGSWDGGWALPVNHKWPLFSPWWPIFTPCCNWWNCGHMPSLARPWCWSLLKWWQITLCQTTGGWGLVSRTWSWSSHPYDAMLYFSSNHRNVLCFTLLAAICAVFAVHLSTGYPGEYYNSSIQNYSFWPNFFRNGTVVPSEAQNGVTFLVDVIQLPGDLSFAAWRWAKASIYLFLCYLYFLLMICALYSCGTQSRIVRLK